MVELYVCKNIVFLDKGQKNYKEFVNKFLTKYESVTKVDYMNSTKFKKKFKSVKEVRYLYTEDRNFIKFSRGILEMIPPSEYSATYREENKAIITPQLSLDEIKKTLDVYDLRDDQAIAVNKCLILKRGIIQMPTATGKSSIIASVVKRLLEYNPDLKILVLAPTLTTVKNINETLVNKGGVVSEVFGHPHKEIRSPVTSSLVQSLVAMNSTRPDLLESIDAVFYDECLPSNSKILCADLITRTIKEIYENDEITEVYSYDIETGLYVIKKILRKFRTPFNERFCKVYYEDKHSGKLAGVSCTKNHKIYTRDRGFIPAEDLTSEDYIKIDYPFTRNWGVLNAFTYMRVKRVSCNIGKVAEYKYNLEIEDTHCYFANNVLVSNCHHLKCDTWNTLNSMLPNVEYSLGFSALSIDKNEVYKTNFQDLSYQSALIVGSTGKVLMHMDPSYYIKKGIIALPVVFRVSHCHRLPEGFDESNWTKLVKLGLMSSERTNKIAKVTSIFSKYNRKVLVLVSEKDYAFTLCRFLSHYGVNNFGIAFGANEGYTFGGYGPPTDEDDMNIIFEREDSFEVINKLDNGEINVLVATSHLDEGADLNELDVCILACGGKKDRKIVQRVGRVLRKSKSGKYGYVVDFTDQGSKVLARQSSSRMTMYKKDIGVPLENIYDNILIENIEDKFKELEGLN